MQLTISEKNITKIAAALGIVQGLTWLILAFICIGIYTSGVDATIISTSYMQSVSQSIALRFLDSNFVGASDFIIYPLDFTIFMWLYVILSAMWLLSSIHLLLIVTKEKNDLIPRTVGVWIISSCLISFIDFLFAILLGTDYGTCMDLTYDSIYDTIRILVQMSCANATIPVIVIVCRGFILWIINQTLIVVLYKMAKRHNYNIVTLLKGTKVTPPQ